MNYSYNNIIYDNNKKILLLLFQSNNINKYIAISSNFIKIVPLNKK